MLQCNIAVQQCSSYCEYTGSIKGTVLAVWAVLLLYVVTAEKVLPVYTGSIRSTAVQTESRNTASFVKTSVLLYRTPKYKILDVQTESRNTATSAITTVLLYGIPKYQILDV